MTVTLVRCISTETVGSRLITRAWSTFLTFLTAGGCLACVLSLGCGAAEQTESAEALSVSSTLAAQLEAGRAGQLQRIELDSPVYDAELKAQLRVGETDEAADVWLEELILNGGEVSDVSMGLIAKLPHLRHLRLRRSAISDDGLRELATCRTLQILNLPHADLSDRGLASLRDLPELRLLRLGGDRLTRNAADEIARLESLRQLHLIGVPIDDRGLRKLADLPKLQSLYLDGSAVSEAGWDWLFETHPDLHVHVNATHLDRDPKQAGTHH
ncbi:MAG: hypothetical protein AAF802_14170 [Planctomycetota bacterium]